MSYYINVSVLWIFQNHQKAAVFAGITCGIVGTYVVSRRMVFLCGGITHASFGGLGIAMYSGINPIVGAMAFAILSAMGIEWASEKGKIREDSAIGIIWSVGMAVGALFMSLTPGYVSGELASYMFGSIITVSTQEVAILGFFSLACIICAIIWWRPIMYLAFDRSYATSQGIPTRLLSYIMMVVVAITTVLAIRIMGIVLLLSLFTIPTAIVSTFTKSYATITLYSAIIAVVGATLGIIASYYWEIPPGTSIIFILSIMLIVTKLLSLRSKNNVKCA